VKEDSIHGVLKISNHHLYRMEEKAKIVCSYFQNSKPFFIGRNGSTELEILNYYYKTKNKNIPQQLCNRIELYSGIFPATPESVYKWIEIYFESLYSVDAIAEGWYEPLKEFENKFLDKIISQRESLFLRNLEPYYFPKELRWTKYLKGKRVGIINPFSELCETQTYMAKAIWGEYNCEFLLPLSTSWIPIRTYFPPSIAGKNLEMAWKCKDWEEAVESLVQKAVSEQIEVALIGCGAIGMIVGARLKALGISVIVMGGALQILFGVRGKRWENHSVISKFFNDAWINVSDDLKPTGAYKIENACYW